MSIVLQSPEKGEYFTEEELLLIHENPLPRHVAIIMDGNRRWAEKNNSLRGHFAGAEIIFDIVSAATELNIRTLTLFGFSTENWHRSEEEVSTLLYIIENYLKKHREKMIQKGVQFHAIGDLAPFPESVKREIEKTTIATQEQGTIDLVVALNYGGRDDLRRAIKKISHKIAQGQLRESEVTEELVTSYLDTAPFGDPDLLIRTGGEERVSNFLLWQLAYTELYVTDTYWPDFAPRDLLAAIRNYQQRQRRKGR